MDGFEVCLFVRYFQLNTTEVDQKDEKGDWTERGKGIRKGNTGGILSNLSAGGSVIDFK